MKDKLKRCKKCSRIIDKKGTNKSGLCAYHYVIEMKNKKNQNNNKPRKKIIILEEFYDIIKKKVRNCGRTNFLLTSEIDEEVVRIGNELYELENEKNKRIRK